MVGPESSISTSSACPNSPDRRSNHRESGVGAGPNNAIHISQVPALGPNPNNHFALEVDGLDALLDLLAARGVEYRRSAYVPAAGHQAFIRDPDGNVIELIQPPA